MRREVVAALIALNLCAVFALPQNKAEKSVAEQSEASVVQQKGSLDILKFMSDDSYVTTCDENECKTQKVSDAKGTSGLVSASAHKGDQDMSAALAPTLTTMQESMKGLNAQKAMLANLQQEMAQLSNAFNKGAQLAESTKGMFAETMMRGVSFAPAKGAALAAAPAPFKGGYAAPPSKGGSAAQNMQLEAAMCPMTMYELGKTQKLMAETKQQLDSSLTMNAICSSQKNQLENALAASETLKQKAEQQAAFNAKYASEQKSRADALAMALAQANAKNAALEQQKASLEGQLSSTQRALLQEKQNNQALTAALQSCNTEKAQLQSEKEGLTQELISTQNTLRATQRELTNERNAHDQTKRELSATQQELDATETARQQLEEAKQQLEDELSETKNQLESMTAERDQLQVNLDATTNALSECNQQNMRCQSDLAQEKAITAQLSSQLQDAMDMLAAEKKAREELTETILAVKAASEKIQEELQRLQSENVQLMIQIQKLKSEQESAMALAAGCPPTYEKFGKSCYKYVREKTQWKMAQEQCMKDSGNLVSVESRQEQAFLVDYLKRHGAENQDSYSLTSGYKTMSHWKWKGSFEQYMGQTGPEYWYNTMMKMKPGYDCQAMYLRDRTNYGKWVAKPCYSAAAAFVCEYNLMPHSMQTPANPKETLAMMNMFAEAPPYLSSVGSKGSYSFAPPSSMKGASAFQLSMAEKGYRSRM